MYASSGKPTAAVAADLNAIIDHKLYWIPCETAGEADYLVGIINSRTLEEAVEPLRPKGQWGARDLHKHPWRLPIPRFDAANETHREIAKASAQAAAGVAAVLAELKASRPSGKGPISGDAARDELRAWLAESDEGQEVERLVAQLLR